MVQASPLILRPRSRGAVEMGDYFSTSSELYRVERVIGDRILLEDCRTEVLIEVGTEQVLAMSRITPSD